MTPIRLSALVIALASGALATAQVAAPVIESPDVVVSEATSPLGQRLDVIFDAPQWENARWGVIVQDLETSQILYERDSEKSFMPASNMKLFTTAASLATLGKDYRFETKIYATGTTDTRGTLRGNIIVVGSGDPSISGRYLDTPTTAILATWADAIAAMGIKSIDGDIIGDDDVFDESAICGSWQSDYLSEWYAAENSGLAINDNCWDTLLIPTRAFAAPANGPSASREIVAVASSANPLQTSYYKIDTGEIEITPNDDDVTTGPPEEEARLSIDRKFGTNEIALSGTLEEDSAPVHEWGSIHNGTLFTVTLLAEELERRGIKIEGDPKDIDDVDEQVAAHLKDNRGTLAHTHESPPLSKLLAIVNKPSQNFYADMLLKVVGAHAYENGSWRNGENAVKDLLTTAGVGADTLNMADGSGLSRRNMVEPRQVLALLTYMCERPDFPVFEASLPIMGVDGTLKGRMDDTPARGNVKAKTGTIGGVRALSGYMTTNSGHRLAFSMLANNYNTPTSAATEAQNQAVLELLKQ